MRADNDEFAFISFVCPSCLQEIETPAALATHETECPSCATSLQIPQAAGPGTDWAKGDASCSSDTIEQIESRKRRTLRIELPDVW